MRIYISHPYGGKPGNKAEIERIAEALAVKDKANVYISPIHCFGYLYVKVDYLHGLGMCLELLKVCDKMLVYGDWEHSTGCKAEIDYCKAHGIPYVLHCDPPKNKERPIRPPWMDYQGMSRSLFSST